MILGININGNGLGDQVCAEPILRFALENYYPKLLINTDFPELFEHLIPKGLHINSDEPVDIVVESNPYFFKDGEWRKHELCEYIHHATMHQLDFMSLFILRQGLPDKYRSIQLTVDGDIKNGLLKLLPNIRNTWLIHAGFGEPTKSFGEQYWQEVVSKLNANSIPTIAIGKNYKSTACDLQFGAYKTNTTVDLIDKLNVKELIALISLAKGVLTNDSAPLHIAGAFDNNLLVIPTIKHPDALMPYRNDSKYYKAKVLVGSKPYYTYYDYSPHNEVYKCIGEIVAPITDANLPTPDEVLRAIIEMDEK